MNLFSKCKVSTQSMCVLKGTTHEHLMEQVKQNIPKQEDVHQQLLKQEHMVKRYVKEATFVLPMKATLFSLYTIPVYVNGKKHQFLIDTGAQVSAIREQNAKKLQLAHAKGNITIGSVGGSEQSVSAYYCKQFRFGGIYYENLPLLKLDEQQFALKFMGFDLIGFDGILGWDLLQHLDFEFDDLDHQFKVLKNIYRFEYKNMVKGPFPTFLVQDQNGNECVFGFDSGSHHSWLSKQYIQKYDLPVKKEIEMIGYGVHGKEVMKQELVQSASFFLDRAKIEFHMIMSGRGNIYPNYIFDGVLGNEIFKNRRLRIINSKEMVLLV